MALALGSVTILSMAGAAPAGAVITGSFGVASFPTHGFSIEDIIRVADAGMYVSKRSGGNLVSAAEEFAAGEEFAALASAWIGGGYKDMP